MCDEIVLEIRACAKLDFFCAVYWKRKSRFNSMFTEKVRFLSPSLTLSNPFPFPTCPVPPCQNAGQDRYVLFERAFYFPVSDEAR